MIPRGSLPLDFFPPPEAAGGSPAPPAARRTRYLLPGELVVCPAPTAVVTVLGSCVAVCLWDAERARGAVNHYLLPGPGRRTDPLRYGRESIARLLERMRDLGCDRPQAKVFGGASVLADLSRAGHLGALNVAVAREELSRAGVPVVACDTGGARGRRLVFQSDTGLALVKRL